MAERTHASFSLFNHPNARLSLFSSWTIRRLSLSMDSPRKRHLSALLPLSHLSRRFLSSPATLLVRPSSRAVSLSHGLSMSLSLPPARVPGIQMPCQRASRWRKPRRGKQSRREDVRTEGRRENKCCRRTEPTKREREPTRGEKEPACDRREEGHRE